MRQSVALITAPVAPPVSIADCKALLGITGDGQDDMIEMSIDAVVGTLDASTGGWLGRALSPQTWELRLDQFPACKIMLPFPVLLSLDSIKYDDQNGVEQTLTEGTDYRVFDLGSNHKASVAPVYNGLWPGARYDEQSVRIRYTCGYDDEIPAAIRSAIGLGVRALLNTSERNLFIAGKSIEGVSETRWVVSDVGAQIINSSINNLLSTYRTW